MTEKRSYKQYPQEFKDKYEIDIHNVFSSGMSRVQAEVII